MVAKTLLIVDDEVDFGNLVRRVAEGLGFEVVVLSDSREFKETYNQLDPDKIVLDIVMPGIDGIEIVNWLISVENEAPVVVVSGFTPRYIEAAEILANHHGRFALTSLTKPIGIAELSAALQS